MLSAAGTMESSMSKAGLDSRHRNRDGEISGKHGNTLIRTLRKVYGQSFAAGYPETEKLSEVLLQLNETSLSQSVAIMRPAILSTTSPMPRSKAPWLEWQRPYFRYKICRQGRWQKSRIQCSSMIRA
jgi:hypothetical protein